MSDIFDEMNAPMESGNETHFFSTSALGSAAASSSAAGSAGSSRASSGWLSLWASVETDIMLPSRPSMAVGAGDASAGSPAVTALAEWTETVAVSPMVASVAGGAAVSMVFYSISTPLGSLNTMFSAA